MTKNFVTQQNDYMNVTPAYRQAGPPERLCRAGVTIKKQ